MDWKLNWKMRVVAAELERMHGRDFAAAFLEDYYRAKAAQLEQPRARDVAPITREPGRR